MSEEKHLVDLKNIDLPTNTPKVYKEYLPYVDVLEKKIKDPEVKNIGIVAPYGAGKSSLIATFREKKENIDYDLDFEYNIISISLANYTSIVKGMNEEENNGGVKNPSKISLGKRGPNQVFKRKTKSSSDRDNYDEQEIEKSILQQLFYKNDNRKTPASRFKALKNNTGRNVFSAFVIMLFAFSIAFLSFQFFDNIFRISLENENSWSYINTAVIATIGSASLIAYSVIRNKHFKSIQVGDLHFEKNENESISVFNQYLDEIIYFFRNNKYNILIIEDLDRFDNLEIFSKLKELNTLLNNNDGIKKKHGKITFIYAVKDTMFKNEEERSKFFEFILPVIPSLTSDNVKDELSTGLSAMLDTEEVPLTPQLIIDISDYISSRRILNNIISDFLIHRALLHIDIKETQKLDKLFSLMVLKNVLPMEYEHLQSQRDESIIFQILIKEKQRIQNEICDSVEKEISDIDEEISSLENEKFESIEELKYMFLGVMLKEHSGFLSLVNSIDTFENLPSVSFKYRNPNSYSTSSYTNQQDVKSLEKKYFNEDSYFAKREKIIISKNKAKQQKLLNRKKELVDKKHSIFNMSFLELYEWDAKQFTDDFFGNPLIQMLLVNGYIDETHMDYLSDHSEGFTSHNDKQIKQRINRKERIGVFEPIDDPDKLILILDKNRFNSANILNYDLAKGLFSDPIKHKEKLEILLGFLRRNLKITEDFVIKLVNSDKPCLDVLTFIAKRIPDVFEWIYSNNDAVSLEKKEYILWGIINHSDIQMIHILPMNETGHITEFINESPELCNKFSNSNMDFSELIEDLNIKLTSLNKFYKNDCSTLILKQCRFVFDLNNINVILSDYFGKNKIEIATCNYDVVCELPDCEFKTNVFDNFIAYLEEVYNSLECGRLSAERLCELLINEDIDIELKKLIIDKESARIQYVEGLSLEIIELLMKKQQIDFLIDDILSVYDEVDTDLMVEYINARAAELKIDDQILSENEGFKAFLFNEADVSKFIDNIGDNYTNISEFKNDDNIICLIKRKKCVYNSDDFVAFCKKEKILKEYCLAFEKEISDDITSGNVVLDQASIATLYKVSKVLNQSYLDAVVKLVDEEALDEIFKIVHPKDFWSSINDLGTLTKGCKLGLLKTNLNELCKEKILCELHEVADTEWIALMKNTIKLKVKNKYSPQYSGFYHELQRRKVPCRKYGYTIVFG